MEDFNRRDFIKGVVGAGDFINHGRQLSFCIDGPGKDKEPL